MLSYLNNLLFYFTQSLGDTSTPCLQSIFSAVQKFLPRTIVDLAQEERSLVHKFFSGDDYTVDNKEQWYDAVEEFYEDAVEDFGEEAMSKYNGAYACYHHKNDDTNPPTIDEFEQASFYADYTEQPQEQQTVPIQVEVLDVTCDKKIEAFFANFSDEGTDVSHNTKEEERILPAMTLPAVQELLDGGILEEGQSPYANHCSSSFGGSSVVNPFQSSTEVLEGMMLANGTRLMGEYVLDADTNECALSHLEKLSKSFFVGTANCKTREGFVSFFIDWRLEVVISMHRKLVDLVHCFPQLGPEPSLSKIVRFMIGKQYPTDTCAELAPEIYDELTSLILRGYDDMPGNLTRPNNACVHQALSGVWTRLRRNILREYLGVSWDVDIPDIHVDAQLFDCLPFSIKPPSKKPDGTRFSKEEHEEYLNEQIEVWYVIAILTALLISLLLLPLLISLDFLFYSYH